MRKNKYLAFIFFSVIAVICSMFGIKTLRENNSNQYYNPISTNEEVYNDAASAPDISFSRGYQYLKPIGTYNIDLILFNFYDIKNYDETSEINYFISNNISKMEEFITKSSYGKLTLNFNIGVVNYNNTLKETINKQYTQDAYIRDTIKNNITYIKNYGKADITLHIMDISADSSINLQYLGYMIPDSQVGRIVCDTASVMLHEIMHVFGCNDLYTKINEFPVSTYELMSSGYETKVDMTYTYLNAYYRQQLGWLTESNYNDNTSTNIEVLDSNPIGVYNINYNNTQADTVAYKIANINIKESYYIEANNTGISVQRINPDGLNNRDYYFESPNYEVFNFRKRDDNGSTSTYFYEDNFGKGQAVSIFDSKGVEWSYYIINIKKQANSYSFEITNKEPKEKYIQFRMDSGIDKLEKSGFELFDKVNISINGKKTLTLECKTVYDPYCREVGRADVKVNLGDTITVTEVDTNISYDFVISQYMLDKGYMQIFKLNRTNYRNNFKLYFFDLVGETDIANFTIKLDGHLGYAIDIYGTKCCFIDDTENIEIVLYEGEPLSEEEKLYYNYWDSKEFYSIFGKIKNGYIEWKYPIYGKETLITPFKANDVNIVPYYPLQKKYVINAHFNNGENVNITSVLLSYDYGKTYVEKPMNEISKQVEKGIYEFCVDGTLTTIKIVRDNNYSNEDFVKIYALMWYGEHCSYCKEEAVVNWNVKYKRNIFQFLSDLFKKWFK